MAADFIVDHSHADQLAVVEEAARICHDRTAAENMAAVVADGQARETRT